MDEPSSRRPWTDRELCEARVLSPLRTAIDFLVCLLIIGAFIPQIIRIAVTDKNSNAGISGWYMLLLSLSATCHLATVLGTLFTKAPMFCIQEGYLRGWKGFSVIGMVFQNLGPDTPLLEGLASGDETVLSSTPVYGSNASTTPSNKVIIAVVVTHAVIIIPPAIYVMLKKLPSEHDIIILFTAQICYFIIAITGFLTSLTAIIPQIHLMVKRSQSGFGLGNLSVLGTGLQCLALIALSASLWVRFASFDPLHGHAHGPVQYFWTWYKFSGASPVGYTVLGVGQLVVLCVALAIGGRGSLYF
ncbi:uncharacterized protein BJX67DRAFT_381077 [Aspergillus lucknowensis]|uniref:Integral membrane protein n=1 Tax=Aspergillus lucknowensis TaxID=176173 RepID=A0ABR4LS63_9EURO